jgi:sporulation integral membrane protein YlbJ
MSKLNKYIISTLFVAFNVCIVLMPDEAFAGARDGLLLWFNRVLPSLVPFAVGINALTGLGVTERAGRYLAPVMKPLFNLPGAAGAAILTGMTSGYPMGAKVTADLRCEGLLSRDEAQRLAGFSNNAGPLFVVGVCGTAGLGSAGLGYRLLFAHLASAMILGVCMGIVSRTRGAKRRSVTEAEAVDAPDSPRVVTLRQPFGRVLGDAARNTMETIVIVGGLIIFFCAASRMLTALGILNGIAGGLLEVTGGVSAIASSGALSINAKLVLTAAAVSFGGLSVHAQAAHLLSGARIDTARYVLCKIIHGLLASAIIWLQNTLLVL